MASPDSTGRIGGAPRPSGGGGVKNLLAMFEKGTSTPNPPGTQTISRELSPGPKPLSRPRTSFVAISGKDGQAGFGLQKIPTSPSSPSFPAVEPTLAPPFSPTPTTTHDLAAKANPDKSEASKSQVIEEPTKKDALVPPVSTEVEEQKSGKAAAPKAEVVNMALPVEKPFVTQENKPPKAEPKQAKPAPPKEPIPKEKVAMKEPQKKEKPVVKPEPKVVSKSNTQTNPAVASNPPTPKNNLTVPASGSRSKPPSPLPSPRRAVNHIRKSSATMEKPKPTSSPPSKVPPKPRLQTVPAAPKLRAPIAPIPHKPFVKPDPKEATKTIELRGTVFAPTASWVAKQGGLPLDHSLARRPPSAAAAHRTLRRQGSTLSDHGGSRPGTAGEHASNSGFGSSTPAPSSDFLNRMMRPTKSSANKVHEKAEPQKIFNPALRAGSAMGRNSEEPNSPPRVKRVSRISPRRIPAPRVGSEGHADVGSPTPHHAAPNVSEPPPQTGYFDPEPIPEEREDEANENQENGVSEEQHTPGPVQTEESLVQELSEHDGRLITPGRKAPELTISIDSGQSVPENAFAKDEGMEDEGHTPTTTSSSATLVHEGDSPDTTKEEG